MARGDDACIRPRAKGGSKGGTMKGVAFPGDRLVSYVDVPDPNPGPLDVIVEMKASGMCGTDLQNYRRPRDQAPYMPSLIGRPPIAGHEPAGIVCAVGTAVPPAQARVGERVMVHHYQGCSLPIIANDFSWISAGAQLKPSIPRPKTGIRIASGKRRRIAPTVSRGRLKSRKWRQFEPFSTAMSRTPSPTERVGVARMTVPRRIECPKAIPTATLPPAASIR
jgi:hypothetical protein